MNISATEVVYLSTLLDKDISGRTDIQVISRFTSQTEIENVLFNRKPSLLLDQAVVFSDKSLGGSERFRIVTKTIITEEHCSGHYPNYPIFPFAQLAENFGQSGCLLLSVVKKKEFNGAIPLAVKANEFRSGNSGPIIPGDVLLTLMEVLRCRSGFAQVSGISVVREEVAVTMDELNYLAVKLHLERKEE